MTSSPSSNLGFYGWLMLVSIGVLIFIMNIDYTAVNLALVPIASDIKGDLNTLQWLLSGYVLIWAALVVPAGRFADIHGKKFSLLLGLSVFMAGSLITGIGNHIAVLIIGRLVQGLGAALFSSPAYSFIFTSVPQEKQGMAMGFVVGTAGLGLAVGPSLAGWMIKEIGWRWLFYINLPLGLAVIIVLWIYAHADKPAEQTAHIDWFSAAFFACGLGSLVFALNQIQVWGSHDPRVWSFGGLGVILLALFAYRDRYQPLQVLPYSLLKNTPFMSVVVAGFMLAYCFSLVLVMMGLYLQNTLRLSSSEAGIYFLSMTLAVGILSPIGGKLADHMNLRIPILCGYALTILALLTFSFLSTDSSTFMVCGGLLLAGLGLGLGFPSMNTGMFRTITPEEINTGSAIFTMAMTLGNSISIIVSTSLVVTFGRPYLLNLMTQAGTAFNSTEQQTLVSIISQVDHSPEQLKQFPADQIPMLLNWIDQAFLHGLSLTLWIGIVLSVLAAGIIFKAFRYKSQESVSAPALPL